jgi:hypothetical protein
MWSRGAVQQICHDHILLFLHVMKPQKNGSEVCQADILHPNSTSCQRVEKTAARRNASTSKMYRGDLASSSSALCSFSLKGLSTRSGLDCTEERKRIIVWPRLTNAYTCIRTLITLIESTCPAAVARVLMTADCVLSAYLHAVITTNQFYHRIRT